MRNIQKEIADKYQDFFNFMSQEHRLILTIEQMDEIVFESDRLVKKLTITDFLVHCDDEYSDVTCTVWNGCKNEMLKSKLLVVSSLGAKFGKDGDQYYYIIGELPEKDCIVGFGETPLKALYEFCNMYGF
jgi:hypothetical protein